jgi:hypothetical protein
MRRATSRGCRAHIASSDTIDSFLLSRRTSFVVMAAVAFFLAVCLWAIVVGLGA